RQVRAVMFDLADRWVAVVNAAHDVCAFGWPDLDQSAPGGVGISGHARRIEKNADRVAVEGVLHEEPVIRRDQKVIAGRHAPEANFDAIIEELLLVGQIDQVEGLAAIDLLDRKNISDVLLRQAGAGALRYRCKK